ncbi:hypothetical protein KKE28_05020 [Patescibacteria group bacterium]|nr:hypothetical protein [Patescibacteria group bacterium]
MACEVAGGCSCLNDDGLSCTIPNGERNCLIPAAAATISPATPSSPVTLTPEWRQFEIGPMRIGNPGGVAGRVSASLSLSLGAARGEAYVDNLVFKRVRDNITVIRNSWNTPLSCNRTREGIYSPLEMLGCRAYRGSDNQTYNLRSFSSLCRPESAGCEAYSQTQNTPTAVGYQTYGAVCDIDRRCGELAGDAPNCPCDYSKPNPASPGYPFVLTDVCRVPLGLSTCRFNLDGLDVSGEATDYPDRFVQPADERLYLVVGTQNMCAQSAVGCRSMGQPVIEFERQCKLAENCAMRDGCSCVDPLTGRECLVESGKSSCQIALDEGVTGSWKGAVVKDDPAKYDQTLCPMEAVGCEKYNASDGARYFKDPSNQVCQFRTNINYRGRKVNGWFRKSASGTVFPCYESFLRGGNIYDIYRNSDPLYTGWVGMCSAEYDRCEEFVDPLDTSASNPGGKPYYYLDNTKLNKSACQGQASLEEGCVLLKQTSNTQNLFSAAASYFRSWREANGALVNAVNCDSPGAETSPNCAQRCYSVAGGICAEVEGDACFADAVCGSAGKCISGQCRTVCNSDAQCGGGECEGDVLWGTGCSAEENVCNQAKGEVCVDYVPPDDASRNDANVIIKVRRDRDCAEWLECDKSQPVYDNNLGRWINRCISFSTCTEGAQVGDSFVCSELEDVPKELFTVNDYVARDIGWNGEEYSGYSIVDRYPLQHLQAYKITTGQCRESGVAEPNLITRDGRIVRCRDTEQCEAVCEPGGSADCTGRDIDEIYCSAPLNGICVGGSQVGLACDNDAHCKGTDNVGYCSQSQFDVIKFGIQRSFCRKGEHYGEPCVQDIDCWDVVPGDVNAWRNSCATSCSQNEVLVGAPPAAVNDGCPPDGYQPICSSDDCPEPWGTCIENSCVYDYRGGPLRTDDIWNAPSCRAYPESESPFPANILDTTSPNVSGDTEATPGYNKFGTPVKLKAPYRGANTCLEGNSCDCFYSRIGYGQGGTKVRYQAFDNSIKYREAPDSASPEASPGPFQSGVSRGVCMGGPYDGMSCLPGETVAPGEDGPCGPSGSAGTCMAYSSFALAAGWPGFCVDKDESDRLYADPNVPGCNLWLPVDVIPGMTDMLSQHPEAGFQSPQDKLLMCSVASGNAGAAAGSGGSGSGLGGCTGDIAIRCDEDQDCIDEGVGICNLYIRYLAGGSNLWWFRTYQQEKPATTDPDGDADGHLVTEPGSRLHRTTLTEIILEVGSLENKRYIVLNEENNFSFATHYDSEFCIDGECRPEYTPREESAPGAEIYFEVGGKKYLINQWNEPDGCRNVLIDDLRDHANESWCQDHIDTEVCIAVKVMWDGSNNYHGVKTATCSNHLISDTNFYAVPVVAAYMRLRETCSELDLVYDKALNPEGAPFTDRLYKLRSGVLVEEAPALSGLEKYYKWLTQVKGLRDAGIDTTILGAVAAAGKFNPVEDVLSHPIPVKSYPVEDSDEYFNSAGSPYYSSLRLVEAPPTAEYVDIDSELGYAIAAGSALSCNGSCKVPEALRENVSIEKITDLFALVYLKFRLNIDRNRYIIPLDWSAAIGDYRASLISEFDHQPPRIIPVNTTSTLCRDQGNTCPELGLVDGISVNGGQRDMCFGGGSQSNVEISYYAYADSDHLPIRRHIIDFGDGTTPVQLAGSFKNTRGLTPDGSPICGSDNTDFGLTPDACDSNYMRFNKTYTCSESFAATLPKCLADTTYPCRDAVGCCVFKPRVQVMDNWGMCNGFCPNDPSGETARRADANLCFNGSTVNYLDESHDASNVINECTILSTADRNYQQYRRPFVAYSGAIVVCPNNCTSDGPTYESPDCAVAERCIDACDALGTVCVAGCCVAGP